MPWYYISCCGSCENELKCNCSTELACAKKKFTVNKCGNLLNFLLRNITVIVHTYKREVGQA